ncbi:MAG: aldo/keto reductase, partial [Rhodospirillaceae bacterium]
DSVDIVHLHNRLTPETRERDLAVDEVLKVGGALDGLERLREAGLTSYIGITALGDTACIKQVVETDRVQSAQVYYNMINPSAARGPGHGFPGQDFAGLLAACRAHGVGTMGIRVFAAGVLATNVRHGREVVVTDDTDVSLEEQRARDAFTKLGVDADGLTPYGTRAQAALRYNLAEPMLDCTIVGLATLDHLRQVLDAAEAGPLPADAVAKLG